MILANLISKLFKKKKMITLDGINKSKSKPGEFVFVKDCRGEYRFEKDDNFDDIDFNCVRLYTAFQNILFTDANSYYTEIATMPIWSYKAGLDSDSGLSKEMFEKFVNENNSEKYHKHLYLADCQYLIGALQDRFLFIKGSFIEFYKALADFNTNVPPNTQVVWCTGANTASIFSNLYNIFITFYSTFDLLTKISYELQYIETDFGKYPKLKSSNILFGDKKRLDINNHPDSIFESNEIITMVSNIRNELIHNGSWETNPKVFICYKDFIPIEKWIFFPDMIAGNIVSYKNRKRFFSSESRINIELPQIVNELINKINSTVTILNNKYA